MYQLYPVVQLKAEEAKSAPFYTSNDYQKDCLLGTGDSFGFVFYQALEKAAREIKKPAIASYHDGKEVAKWINYYFKELRNQIAGALQDYLCAHDGRVDRWPDPDTGYELTLRSENNYLDGIFQFHFLAGDYQGKGNISYKFSRPTELCKPKVLPSSRKDRTEFPEARAYEKKLSELNDQVKKASLFSKKRAQRELDEFMFSKTSTALVDAHLASMHNYDALLDAWLDAWLACCTAKGLRVTDPDVKERRQEENA